MKILRSIGFLNIRYIPSPFSIFSFLTYFSFLLNLNRISKCFRSKRICVCFIFVFTAYLNSEIFIVLNFHYVYWFFFRFVLQKCKNHFFAQCSFIFNKIIYVFHLIFLRNILVYFLYLWQHFNDNIFCCSFWFYTRWTFRF